MKLLIFQDTSTGGIADYAHLQANALAARGVEVEMLVPAGFKPNSTPLYRLTPALEDWRQVPAVGVFHKLARARTLLRDYRVLADHVAANPPDAVLTHFSEYLAPIWAPRLRWLRRKGVRFASILHDPMRDHRVGPESWHKRSVDDAFSFLDLVFIHTLDLIEVPGGTLVRWIPFGNYEFPDPVRPADEVRRDLGVPENATLAISYGFIRDNKNLDLIIEALARRRDIHLIVAGREQSGRQKPLSYYWELAERLNCAERVHWLNYFLDEEETADLFSASDVLMLTYSRSFKSWSAVLSLAARYRLPAIVSGGTTTLGALVGKFRTGVRIEPDDVAEISRGFEIWEKETSESDWAGYDVEMSWERNAELVESHIAKLKNES